MWATERPKASAVVQGSIKYSYEDFATAIAACQQQLSLPPARASEIVVVITKDLLESWTLSLAARALGYDAIVVHHANHFEALALQDVAWVYTAGSEHELLLSQGAAAVDPARLRAIPHADSADAGCGASIVFGGRWGSQILYTTGTTGTPKKVLMAGDMEDRRNAYRAESFAISSLTVAYTDLPAYSGAGFKTPSAVWHAGGAMIFDRSLDLEQAVRRYRVSCAVVGPNQLRSFVASGGLPGDLRHSFEIVYTSGPLPYELARRTAEIVSRNISLYFGATEIIGRPLRARFTGGVEDLVWLEKEPGRDIRVVDEQGNPVGPDTEGRLAVQLAEVDATSYLGDDEASRRIFRNGYFVPGDMAVARQDGRVRLLGREADVINIRGTKTSLFPLETAIQDYLGAEEVCIFTGMNAAGDEEAIVAVRSARNITPVEMQEIAVRFLPFGLVRFARLTTFPRSEGAFGKTLRGELRKMLYAARLD